jgi:hypothetical protein
MNEITDATHDRAQKFSCAYAEWMEATAVIAKMDAGKGMTDEEAHAAADRLVDAERHRRFVVLSFSQSSKSWK